MEYRVWSIGAAEGRRSGLEAVQRCKSERSSCAKVQRWRDGVAGDKLARGPVDKGEIREYRVWSIEYRESVEGTRTRGLEDLYSLLALMCSQPPTANRYYLT